MHLFFDCETTGLPARHVPDDHPSQPHIIQLAAILADKNLNELACLNVLIEPEGWAIPPEVASLTGITTEKAERGGIPIKRALQAFLPLWQKADGRVAHNEAFDARMMRIELLRQQAAGFVPVGLCEAWDGGMRYCTMEAATPIVNLPPTSRMLAAGFDKPKPPKLIEAHQHFFGCGFENAHDALADVRACMAIFKELRRLEATQDTAEDALAEAGEG